MSPTNLAPTGLAGAVSSRYGLVRWRAACTAAAGLPPVAIVSAVTAEPGPTLQVELSSGAGGAARRYPAAAASGAGEAVERYSAAFVPYDQLLFGNRGDLDLPSTPSEQWALYSPDETGSLGPGGHQLVNLSDALDVGWVRARRLHDGRMSAVPAQWVYLGYLRGRREPPLVWTTSTGLACADDLPTAVLRGLLEVVERDAFLRTWRRRLVLPRVRLDGLLARHRWLADGLGRPGGPYLSVVDLTPLTVTPTMLATLRHPHPEMPALAVGAASALTGATAATKAVIEACHTAYYAAGLRLSELCQARDALGTPSVLSGRGGLADGFDQHVRQYVDHARAARAAFLDVGPVTVDLDWDEPPPAGDPQYLSGRLARRWQGEGVETYAVDVTAPDVAEIGLAVARVLSPQAAQLDVAAGGAYLGQPRLRRTTNVPGDRDLDTASLNHDLHPFP